MRLVKELEAAKSEHDLLVKEKKDLQDANIKIETELIRERRETVSAQLTAKGLAQRNENLRKQFEDSTAQIRELREQLSGPGSSGLGGGGPVKTSILNPPPKPAPAGVVGKVTGIAGNLVQVNVGIDTGLSEGNELMLYQEQAGGKVQYLGQVKITTAQAKKAAGRFYPASTSTKLPGENDDGAIEKLRVATASR